MSTNITNTAQITYNETTSPPTCPVVTKVEPNISVHKFATTEHGRFSSEGTMGEMKKATYDILLVNHSSTDFTNVVINDKLRLPEGVTAAQVTYVTDESMFPNSGDIPNIVINVGTLEKESEMLVHYTLQFADSVPVGTVINNKAYVNYTENPRVDPESGESVPYPTDRITLTILFTGTTVVANKEGPTNVLCGELFDYVLTFTNTGENPATDVSIEDELPAGFIINKVTVVNGETTLSRDTDYTYEDRANPLIIQSVGNALEIQPDTMLTVTINGSYLCPFDDGE